MAQVDDPYIATREAYHANTRLYLELSRLKPVRVVDENGECFTVSCPSAEMPPMIDLGDKVLVDDVELADQIARWRPDTMRFVARKMSFQELVDVVLERGYEVTLHAKRR